MALDHFHDYKAMTYELAHRKGGVRCLFSPHIHSAALSWFISSDTWLGLNTACRSRGVAPSQAPAVSSSEGSSLLPRPLACLPCFWFPRLLRGPQGSKTTEWTESLRLRQNEFLQTPAEYVSPS